MHFEAARRHIKLMFHFTSMTDDAQCAADPLSQAAESKDGETAFARAEEPVPEAAPGGDKASTVEAEEASQHPQAVNESPDEVDDIQGFQQANEAPNHVDPVQEQVNPADPECVKPEDNDAKDGDEAHDEELHIPDREPVAEAEATGEAPPDLLFDTELSDAFNEASPTRKRVATAPLSTMVESMQKGNQVLSSIVNQLREINADLRNGLPE
jgi:hypothetical protein